ncbi:hypothetical protein OF385_02625 [Glutamicibacter sp. JL.03c]|uniref:hypothetical protein n=1 Tax=Glutamicibacter sp. JL.03c TaxID=2984842 RepID=UPI0021F6C68F|nr:hypothetical protein [Glutamicibacter sp. JL.03c]UYQ78084.1 hypothetical protein OF385_02625 [Glutamicibacter sp. JL.03c]
MPTQRELQRELMAKNPHYSAGQAKAVAKKMIWLEENVGYDAVRIHGIISDPTAREAVKNLEATERKSKMKERPNKCSV